MSRPVRITSQEMARLAFDHPGAQIELAEDSGLAFLTVDRVDYVATYDEAVS